MATQLILKLRYWYDLWEGFLKIFLRQTCLRKISRELSHKSLGSCFTSQHLLPLQCLYQSHCWSLFLVKDLLNAHTGFWQEDSKPKGMLQMGFMRWTVIHIVDKIRPTCRFGLRCQTFFESVCLNNLIFLLVKIGNYSHLTVFHCNIHEWVMM